MPTETAGTQTKGNLKVTSKIELFKQLIDLTLG